MVQAKQTKDLISDEIEKEIKDYFKSSMLYYEAECNLIEMKAQGCSYDEMRVYLTNDHYNDLNEKHEGILHWLVDQWGAYFKETGFRYSNNKH